jgi:hypothetical protein
VNASVTSWNPSAEVRGAVDLDQDGEQLDDLQRSTWEAIRAEGWAEQYWPCLGAIVQVAVYPSEEDGEVAPDDFPHFTNVEPKKRELYETRSETGEILSGTPNELEVRKGMTETKATEESTSSPAPRRRSAHRSAAGARASAASGARARIAEPGRST